MVDIAAVKDWVESTQYNELLSYVKGKLNFRVGDEQVSEILLKHDVNKLDLAGVSLHNLSEFASRKEEFCKYLAVKFSIIKGTEDEQEGGGKDDKVLQELPFYKNFLNLHLIEFYILNVKPDFLDVYLKSIRIPNSKKYAVQLKKSFSLIK
jgi:hypothetical protein